MSELELSIMSDPHDQVMALEKRLRDMERWGAQHDGRLSAMWEAQERHNLRTDQEVLALRDHMDGKFGKVFAELTNLRVRVALWSALAAGGATGIVQFLLHNGTLP